MAAEKAESAVLRTTYWSETGNIATLWSRGVSVPGKFFFLEVPSAGLGA